MGLQTRYNALMPMHDWTRVSAGTFHSFHLGWLGELTRALNSGLLPEDYYALAEQRTAEFEPDLLALEYVEDSSAGGAERENNGGGTAIALSPPKAQLVGEVDEASLYALKRRTIAIRHATNDRIVALLEIASPGNKDRRQSVQSFVDKAVACLQAGYHLVVVDPFPPGRHDPSGLGSEIWQAIGGQSLERLVGQLPSATSFRVAASFQCYCEPIRPGRPLPEPPLFYDPEWYVDLPLERTYQLAYEGVPKRWKKVIEKP
jgi:hypothetical protein